MNEEARLLILLWETVSESLAVNERKDIAKAIIKVLIEENEMEFRLLQDAEGECQYLDAALSAYEEESLEEEDDLIDIYGGDE